MVNKKSSLSSSFFAHFKKCDALTAISASVPCSAMIAVGYEAQSLVLNVVNVPYKKGTTFLPRVSNSFSLLGVFSVVSYGF